MHLNKMYDLDRNIRADCLKPVFHHFQTFAVRIGKIINYDLYPHFSKNVPQYVGGACFMPALMLSAPGSIRASALFLYYNKC